MLLIKFSRLILLQLSLNQFIKYEKHLFFLINKATYSLRAAIIE